MSDAIHLVTGSTVYRVHLNGEQEVLRRDCTEAVAMVNLGDDLLIQCGRTLFCLWSDNNDLQLFSPGWERTPGLLACPGDHILFLQGRHLFELEGDGSHTIRRSDMGGTTHAATLGERLFLVEDGVLEEIDTDDWSWRVVRQSLGDVTAMTCARGLIYITQEDGDLFQIDPEDGTWERLSDDWYNTRALAAVGDTLVALTGSTLYEIHPDGSHRVISADWENVHALAAC